MEDQNAIKGEFDQIGIRPIRVSHLGILEESKNVKEKGREERYGFMTLSMDAMMILYGNYLSMELIWKCMYGYRFGC